MNEPIVTIFQVQILRMGGDQVQPDDQTPTEGNSQSLLRRLPHRGQLLSTKHRSSRFWTSMVTHATCLYF